MKYTFRALSTEEEDFQLEIKIAADSTFSELNSFLLKSLKYEEGQMCSFYLTNREWEKEMEITQMDLGDNEDILNMAECTLGDYLAKSGDRLLWVFDLFQERALNMELMKTNETGKATDGDTAKAAGSEAASAGNELLRLEGKVPEQIKIPGSEAGLSADDLLGSMEDEDPGDDVSFESIDDLDI